MDTKVIESLVPMTARPYLRAYLQMERVEKDKELLAFILPLIPYDERADLVFDSYINVASDEVEVINKFMQDKNYILSQIRVVTQIDARLDDINNFLEEFVNVFRNNTNNILTRDNLTTLINRGIDLSTSIPPISQEYEENQESLNRLTRFYEDEVMITYLQYLGLHNAI